MLLEALVNLAGRLLSHFSHSVCEGFIIERGDVVPTPSLRCSEVILYCMFAGWLKA